MNLRFIKTKENVNSVTQCVLGAWPTKISTRKTVYVNIEKYYVFWKNNPWQT